MCYAAATAHGARGGLSAKGVLSRKVQQEEELESVRERQRQETAAAMRPLASRPRCAGALGPRLHWPLATGPGPSPLAKGHWALGPVAQGPWAQGHWAPGHWDQGHWDQRHWPWASAPRHGH